ncbi:MAG: hypothetical protein IKE69_00470, partial [Thermoguttaceae bacterium]|nr:hypothetical protein [Thermoguttaceae bacterium]
MAKKAGTLAIALTANSTLFDRALVRAERRINSFAAAAKKDFTAIGAAMGAHYLIGAGKTMIDELDQIGKRSDVLGISTERYQMLSAAATHTGVAMGDVESAMIRMNNVLAKAAVGDQKAISSFNLLGLEVEKLRSMRPDELF